MTTRLIRLAETVPTGGSIIHDANIVASRRQEGRSGSTKWGTAADTTLPAASREGQGVHPQPIGQALFRALQVVATIDDGQDLVC